MSRYLLILVIAILMHYSASARNQQQVTSADSSSSIELLHYLAGEHLDQYKASDIQFFTNGHDKFSALIKDIDQAQHKIWIEYFIFANDSIGSLVMDHLVQAAQRGCEVRVITDYYKDRERHFGMSRRQYADSLASLGVDFQMYGRFTIPWVNDVARDHRKIVNIDDRIGYIGGLNIADYYLNGNPKYGGWRDIHARIEGEAVEGMAQLFHKQYVASGGKGAYTFNNNQVTPAENSCADVVYFERSRESKKKKAETRNAIIAALDAARDTIRLVTPYLMPTHTVRQAMIRALDRGVVMEVMFSKVGDIELISSGNYHFAKRLFRHGANVFLCKGDFHHSKIIMVDGEYCMVGSANLNSRSLKWDYEASAFIFGKEPTQELNRIFGQDKLNSDTFSLSYYRKHYSLGFRLKGWFSDRFLTPIL